jgi:hypothetical protein
MTETVQIFQSRSTRCELDAKEKILVIMYVDLRCSIVVSTACRYRSRSMSWAVIHVKIKGFRLTDVFGWTGKQEEEQVPDVQSNASRSSICATTSGRYFRDSEAKET